MDELRLNPVYYTAEHLALRESVRRFVAAEITPHVAAWDDDTAGLFFTAYQQSFAERPGFPDPPRDV